MSADGTLLLIVGNNTAARIYVSNGAIFSLSKIISVKFDDLLSRIFFTSDFFSGSISSDKNTISISGETGEIYVYKKTGSSYSYQQRIRTSLGNSDHSNTYSLKLSHNGTTLVAGTDKNFITVTRTNSNANFDTVTVYHDCNPYNSSSSKVTLTTDASKIYSSCYQPSPIHILQFNTSNNYQLIQTLDSIQTVSSLSNSD